VVIFASEKSPFLPKLKGLSKIATDDGFRVPVAWCEKYKKIGVYQARPYVKIR
jgi:hypothetical protein